VATQFTQADIESVNCAIKQIVDGKRKVTVDVGGRIEQYQATRLNERARGAP
jgi:hypothetical protein